MIPEPTAGETLATWRAAQGRGLEDDGARVFWVALGPLRLPVPHPGQLRLHDLHHVLLGYRTDVIGGSRSAPTSSARA